MKKLLGILVLALLLFNTSLADDINLKGIKEFKLLVRHDGDCNGEKFVNDINTSAKYILGNSKIKLTEEASKEYLYIYIQTVSDSNFCASYLKVETFRFGFKKNSAGNEGFGPITSYKHQHVSVAMPASNHKKTVIGKFESMIKKFVVEWMDAQK